MEKQNIAIVGLDAKGAKFLDEMLNLQSRGVQVAAVTGADKAVGEKARKAGVQVLSLDEMVNLGESLDIIFELSGDQGLRAELRKTLFASNNRHTVIAPASVARLIWTLIDEGEPPAGLQKSGY